MNQDRKFGYPLPQEFLDAEKYYKEVLKKDPQWMQEHLGKFVAIIGQNVVAEAEKFQDLSLRVRREYGYGAIFMPEVRYGDRVIRLGPRTRIDHSPHNL